MLYILNYIESVPFSEKKSLNYAKRLRITASIFVEETREQVKYGLLQHTL